MHHLSHFMTGPVLGTGHHRHILPDSADYSTAHPETPHIHGQSYNYQFQLPPPLGSGGVSRYQAKDESGAIERDIRRRIQHSSKERERRERMNKVLGLLEDLNPKITKNERLTKLDILERTASYIKELQELVGYQPPARDNTPRRPESQSFSPDYVDSRFDEHPSNDHDDWRVLSPSPPGVQNRRRRRCNSDEGDDNEISNRAHRRRRHTQVAAEMPTQNNSPAYHHAQLAESVGSQDAYAAAAAAAAANVDAAAAALPLPEPSGYTLADLSARDWSAGLRSPDDMSGLMSASSYDSTTSSSIALSHAPHYPAYAIEASEDGSACQHGSSPVKSSIGFLTT
ncbi:Upstream stimulatory factor 1 [Coemansia sp. S610]|nr:Upstream stimulatory factor 1 [Coemansia sp. S610]